MVRRGSNNIIYKSDYAIIECYGNKQKYEILIDKEDVPKLKHFGRISITGALYVTNSKHKLLHRYLMNCPVNMVVDHINRDTMDNRKSNLRIVDRSINQLNRGKQSNNKSTVIGVHKSGNGWRATFQYKGKVYRKFFIKFEDAVMYRERLVTLYSPIGGVL